MAPAWRALLARLDWALRFMCKLECCAAAGGVRRITCETLATNERALSLARKAGYMISESARGVMRLEKRLALSEKDNGPPAAFERLISISQARRPPGNAVIYCASLSITGALL